MTDVPSHSRTARWGWVCMLLIVLIATGKATWGQSDGLARSVIFDEQILAENIEFIREQLRELSSEQQFDLLKGCVLPGDSHPTIRLSGKFQTPEPQTSGSIRKEPSDSFRFLVSPVSDLLDVAESLDRLDEITDQVKAYDPTDEPQIRARLALLTLLAIRRQNENESDRYCHELTLRVARQPLPKLADRWPETLVTWEAMRQKSLLPQAETLLFQIMESQVRKNHCAGPGEWNLAMGGLLGRIREFQSDSESDSPGLQNLSSNKLERWAPVTKDNVWHAGTHVPPALWMADANTVRNSASRNDEYLMFTSPLSGEYVFECDCTGFGYRDCHPYVAGAWIAPVYTHQSLEFGGLNSFDNTLRLDPPLSQVGDWLRYRVEVSADAVRRHINGRLVHEDQTLTTRDPWIAIRSPYYGRGEVKNIRITGSPNVPDVLHLTDFRDQVAAPFPDADHPHSTLTNSVAECWIPWYRDLEGHPPTWRREPQPDGTHVLLGRKFPDLEGSFCERLLRYHWPLPENFEIQYEFFYEPGEVEVHPALGRFAFLLHPDGLAFHEITNGPMDTGAIDPLNADPLPSSLPIVMKDGCWNQLTLSRQGSVVALSLNGESIGSFKPPKETDSRFGLFYYCDQTSAQIRNVTLKGSWPKEIPDWKEQELAGQDLDELNRLRDSFTNQFVEEFDAVTGVFPPNFQVSHYSVDSDDKITPTENGLQISLSSEPQRVRVVSLSPEITLTGDFDAIVEFSDFVATPAKGGNASISLEVNVPELAGMVGRTFRGGIDRPNSPNQQVAIAEFHNLAPGKPRFIWAGKTSEACTAGRLRIARRGAMVSFLIAEYDSDNYRLLDEREMTDAPLGPGTIRFKCYCTPAGAEPSQVSVTWNRLQILGEDILSPPRTLPNLFFENLFQID